MMRRVMIGQLVEIAVILAAHATVERIALLVYLHVVLDVALLDEGLLADVAPVRSLPVVYADVVDKVDLLDEADATD
uniref:Putative secreted protein n=1 Tax=Anopheles darlingi TaxID=43151 RepID=A0A2M4D0Z4_ANODA